MSNERLDALIDEMLNLQDSVQPRSLFYEYKEREHDLESTFFGFLISRCILRPAIEYDSYGIFKFSKPGREIMEDKNKRAAFVETFLQFYNESPTK